MSLSQNREGRQRDTYLNLLKPRMRIAFLAPTRKAAEEVDLASKPVEGSEWELLESDGPIHPLAVVVMKCRLLKIILYRKVLLLGYHIES